MKWNKVDDYAIRSECGRFHIAKYYLDGCTLFGLWDGDTITGHFEDSKEARSKAEELRKSGNRV